MDTVQMVQEFFLKFKLRFAAAPSVPLTTPTENGQLLTMAHQMEELANRCWQLADETKDEQASGLFLRLQLIQEELCELAIAMASNDPVEYLDALSDLQYVLDNAYVAYGFHHLKMEAFREVHASNMSKLTKDGEPLKDEAGRVVKSKQYRPPNLHQFLEGMSCGNPHEESLGDV